MEVSCVTITVHAKNGKQYVLAHGDDAVWHDEAMPVYKDGAFVYTFFPSNEDASEEVKVVIQSVQDFAATLFFNDCDEPADYNVIAPIFAFLIGKLSGRKLIKALREYEGFEELEDIDPSDYEEKEDLNEAIIEVLESALSELDCFSYLENEDMISAYKKLVRNVKLLSDIEKIVVEEQILNAGEENKTYTRTYFA